MDIMNRIPVKSLLQFRTVSKQWKSYIDSFNFIRDYGFREIHTCCFNLTYKRGLEGFMCSVDENFVFTPLNVNFNIPLSTPIATSEGVWCFSFDANTFLFLWNPSIKKMVGTLVPNYTNQPDSPKMLFGFGVHPDNLDPTILKINYPLYDQGSWYVSVFTVSSRRWYNLESYCLPRESIRIKRAGQAVIGGKIYWVGSEKFYGDDGISFKIYMLVSFDLITHQFQLIDMPEQLGVGVFSPPYSISQLHNSLIISGSFNFGDMRIIYAWALQIDDGEVSSYSMLFNIPYQANHQLKLLGFNKDEEPIVEANDMHNIPHWLQVFNPTVESFQNVGVEGNGGSFFIGPYKESLVLLTELNNELM
ncbi:F-box domain containing protein [Tanacetum coccineum]